MQSSDAPSKSANDPKKEALTLLSTAVFNSPAALEKALTPILKAYGIDRFGCGTVSGSYVNRSGVIFGSLCDELYFTTLNRHITAINAVPNPDTCEEAKPTSWKDLFAVISSTKDLEILSCSGEKKRPTAGLIIPLPISDTELDVVVFAGTNYDETCEDTVTFLRMVAILAHNRALQILRHMHGTQYSPHLH